MAATTNRAAWQAMQSMLMRMGGVREVLIGEPRSAIEGGTVAIIPDVGRIPEANLKSPHETHAVVLRRYEDWLTQPQEETEFKLDAWRAQIQADYFGDFTLGGEVAYPELSGFQWSYDVEVFSTKTFRTLDVMIVYRVFDRAEFAANG